MGYEWITGNSFAFSVIERFNSFFMFKDFFKLKEKEKGYTKGEGVAEIGINKAFFVRCKCWISNFFKKPI